jgi:ketosteroid isomerase-like protein
MKSSPLVIVVSFFLLCCQEHRSSEILNAMHHYDKMILAMNPDSIANVYTADGELGDQPIAGRDSIRKFLMSFTDFKVLETQSTSSSISFKGDSAFQEGSYYQKTKLPAGDTVMVKGLFSTVWLKGADNRWLIRKIHTRPL